MSQYKLTYFNARARGELIRLVFAAAGVQFEDVRIDLAQWADLKPNVLYGQLPMLEFDGYKICQTKAIARFLARRYGLAGNTEQDMLRADMIVDCMDDLIWLIIQIRREGDETKRAELKQTFHNERLPAYLSNVEKLLLQNNDGESYFVGDSLTWADLSFLAAAGYLQMFYNEAEQIKKFAKLQALKERAESHPRIAAWLSSRPPPNSNDMLTETPFRY